MIFLQLFYEFFKTGLFAVGGGLATLPFLNDICQKYDWFTEQMLADMIAISESTPGPIGINMATYAGYQAAGLLGSIVATCSLVAPSIIVIVLIARFLSKFNEHPLVKSAFSGLRPAVTGLIAAAAVSVMKLALLRIPAFEASFYRAFCRHDEVEEASSCSFHSSWRGRRYRIQNVIACMGACDVIK